MEVSGQLGLQAALPTEKNASTHKTGVVGSRASLEVLGERKNLLPFPEFEPWVVRALAYSIYCGLNTKLLISDSRNFGACLDKHLIRINLTYQHWTAWSGSFLEGG
jgi:hypothetical protein